MSRNNFFFDPDPSFRFGFLNLSGLILRIRDAFEMVRRPDSDKIKLNKLGPETLSVFACSFSHGRPSEDQQGRST